MTAPPASLPLSLLNGMSAQESAHSSPLAALTQRMAAGDDAAFAEFHSAYAPRLFRYLVVCHRGDEQTAADVLQDTLIRVVRHARRFDDERVFWDWLTRLARTAAADHGRKGGRYLRFLERFWHSQPEVSPPNDDELASALDQALALLADDDASLLRAKYDEQQSQRDLAQQFGVTEEAIESRLRRARGSLKTLAFQILRQQQS